MLLINATHVSKKPDALPDAGPGPKLIPKEVLIMLRTNAANLGMHILEQEITTRCDKNCLICYNRLESGFIDLPIEIVFALIDFAERFGVNTMPISGGEASMHPEFKKLCRHLLKRRPKIRMVLQSNGKISDIDFNLLKCFDAIHLSFEPDTTGVRTTSSNDILKLAQELKLAGIYVYLFATIHPHNIDSIDWMIETANSHNLDIGFNLCIPNGIAKKYILTREQVKFVTEKINTVHEQKKCLRFATPLTAIVKNQKTQKYEGIKGGCTAGVSACVILPNGDVVPCPFLRIKAGNIYEQKLSDIWLKAPLFSRLRKRIDFDNPCGSCQFLSYCGGCRGRALTLTQSLTGCDPYCFLEELNIKK